MSLKTSAINAAKPRERTYKPYDEKGLFLTASFFTSIAAMYLLDLCDTKAFGAFNDHTLHFPGAPPSLSLWFMGVLFTGIATTIAAHVMEEARAIAADHAEII